MSGGASEAGVKIRPAEPGDAAALAVLMGQLGYPTSEAEMAARLGAILPNEEYATLLAEVDGLVAGMIGLRVGYFYERDGMQGQIMALVVADGYRDRAIGARLVGEGERWFAERHVRTVVLTSRHSRTGAHRFYRRLGNEATGLRFGKVLEEKGGEV